MVELPPDVDIKYCALGGIVIQWGFVEEFINDCVLFLYHKCDGKNTKTCKNSGMPRSQLHRKLTFLTEMLESPVLSKYKVQGLNLICRVGCLAKQRDTIIHGAIIDMQPDSFKFEKHIYDEIAKKSNKPKLEHFEYSLDDLNRFGNMTMALANDLVPFVQSLFRDIGNYKFD